MTSAQIPFFSVIIPVYNRANVLRWAIESVLAQTEQDFEIIVVDDGSSDNPQIVIDRIVDPRIHYERQLNGGGGSARNKGIDLARGQFVAFLDSDDIFLPCHLATMRAVVEGTDQVAAYARIIVDRGTGQTFLKPPRAIAPDEHMATYLTCERGFVPTTTLVVAREIAARVRYDESLPYAQDTDFAVRLFLAGCRFVMADAPGAVWYDRPDPARSSAGRKGALVESWLEKLRPVIPPRAYFGARGWMIAKGVAASSRARAFGLYWAAVSRGCYRPRLAALIFLQIFVSDALYRFLADWIIVMLQGAVWSRAEQRVAAPGK